MMQPVSVTLRRLDKNTIPELALIALWFAGLSLGLWAACRYGDAYASFLQPLAGYAPELAYCCFAGCGGSGPDSCPTGRCRQCWGFVSASERQIICLSGRFWRM